MAQLTRSHSEARYRGSSSVPERGAGYADQGYRPNGHAVDFTMRNVLWNM